MHYRRLLGIVSIATVEKDDDWKLNNLNDDDEGGELKHNN